MQDARAQNAAAQGDAATNALDAARQAQLNAITVNGLNREQIEARIKQIKKDIAAIEFGALRNARDAVDAAEKALEKAISALTYRRKTREQWELEAAAVDAAEKKVLAYEKGVYRALKDSEKIVKAWEKLNNTFTTTHIVNTVYNGTPAPGAADPDPAPKKKKKRGGGNSVRRVADGGFISGPGTATSDSILAMLSDGEYVIKAASVDKFGTGFLDSVNAGQLPGFKIGGMVREGGGSRNKSTPAKPVARVSEDAAERRAQAAKPNQAQTEAAAQKQRDALYRQGGFQGFEAGLGSTMAAFAKSAPGKFLADAYSGTGLGNQVFRGALALLSTPAEIVGSLAKNAMDFVAKPNLESLIKEMFEFYLTLEPKTVEYMDYEIDKNMYSFWKK
jgi:hypothetical protein